MGLSLGIAKVECLVLFMRSFDMVSSTKRKRTNSVEISKRCVCVDSFLAVFLG